MRFQPVVIRITAIAAGFFLSLWHPSAAWVEGAYVNGAYPAWEHLAVAIDSFVPWSLGDVAVLAGLGLVAWRLRRRDWLGALAILGCYATWFQVGWGWNYDRAPIEARVRYDRARVTTAAIEALRARAIAEMNRLAPLAHARTRLDARALAAAWTPVVRAGGDRWTPSANPPKPTLADPFMAATGTSGYINPLTLNVHLASDLLWFERPFSLAHEWSHDAAYAREDEANYLAILACTRARDPALQYSGWLELFLYLPARASYPRSTFVPLVWSDFEALRTRNAARINARLATLSWHAYNAYLKSNRIASGIENYDEVTRLYLGIPLDRDGLPEPPAP